MAEPFCERYALNMAFDPAACPAPAELSCLPRCRELLDANVDCYSPRPQDLTGADAWLAYPDGVACEAADGAAGGCRAGVCVPLAVCGNGVVEPGEECDDDVGVLHGRVPPRRRRRVLGRVLPGAGVRGGADDRRRRLRARAAASATAARASRGPTRRSGSTA